MEIEPRARLDWLAELIPKWHWSWENHVQSYTRWIRKLLWICWCYCSFKWFRWTPGAKCRSFHDVSGSVSGSWMSHESDPWFLIHITSHRIYKYISVGIFQTKLGDIGGISHRYGPQQTVLNGMKELLELPVVPHKAVAEVSKIGNLYRRGWLLWITDGRANPLMDRQVAGVVFFGIGCNGCSGHLTTTAGCSVV